jgi:hypothetical protein
MKLLKCDYETQRRFSFGNRVNKLQIINILRGISNFSDYGEKMIKGCKKSNPKRSYVLWAIMKNESWKNIIILKMAWLEDIRPGD